MKTNSLNYNTPTPPAVDGRKFLINGTIETWAGDTTEIGSTSSPLTLGTLAKLDAPTALRALASAKTAWRNGRGEWPLAHPNTRIAAVEAFANRMRAKVKDLATMLCWEIAKPYKDSEKEITRTIEYIDRTVDAYKALEAKNNEIENVEGFVAQVRRSPLGVTLVMGPYNYPINETFCLLIPALIMGNTVVIKGARFGALTLQMLLADFQSCFPKGVINTINGDGPTIINPIMASGDVDVFAFIGSAGAARKIMSGHPKPNHLRRILGLEAKNVAIICADANLDNAVEECVAGALSYNGQRCTAIKMILAHASIKDAFTEKLVARVHKLTAGNPFDLTVNITPMPSLDEVKRLQRMLANALAAGAHLADIMLDGGNIGGLMTPAILKDVTTSMEIANSEQFGPIVPIGTWEDPHAVLNYLENLAVGQQLSVFTNNPVEAGFWIDQTAQLQCRLNLNSQCQRGPDVFPFTGRKDSAEGTLSITDALRCFSIRSMVAIKKTPTNITLAQKILSEGTSNFFSTHVIL